MPREASLSAPEIEFIKRGIERLEAIKANRSTRYPRPGACAVLCGQGLSFGCGGQVSGTCGYWRQAKVARRRHMGGGGGGGGKIS